MPGKLITINLDENFWSEVWQHKLPQPKAG
jgi:hypothetical protein